MSGTIQCPHCGQRYTLKDGAAPKHVKCAKCGQVFPVASAEPPPLPPEAPPLPSATLDFLSEPVAPAEPQGQAEPPSLSPPSSTARKVAAAFLGIAFLAALVTVAVVIALVHKSQPVGPEDPVEAMIRQYGADQVATLRVEGVSNTSLPQIYARLAFLGSNFSSHAATTSEACTITLAPVPDLSAFVAKIDFGEVTTIDAPRRMVVVKTDPSRLDGSAKSAAVAQPPQTSPEADRITAETIAALADLNKNLATVRNQASMQAALPRVRKSIDRIRSLSQEAQALEAKGVRPADWRKSAELAARMQQMTASLGQEMARVMAIPGGDEMMMELLRLADVQWAAGAAQVPLGLPESEGKR